jgi:predicted RecB family nuclease
MLTHSEVFDSYIKCPTKCWLLLSGAQPTQSMFASWDASRADRYRSEVTDRLLGKISREQDVSGVYQHRDLRLSIEHLKSATWRFAINVTLSLDVGGRAGIEKEGKVDSFTPGNGLLPEADQQARPAIEIRLDAIEKLPPVGRGKLSTFIPIRFFASNHISSSERMTLALDALALTEMIGRLVKFGKIIHGDEHSIMKIKTAALFGQLRHHSDAIETLTHQKTPPRVTLIRHCAECQFRTLCRQVAIEKDDLTLLSNMNAKERQKLNEKGIFTVTQLSYTFRPRRKSIKRADKPEKFSQALRALSLRENKIYVSGRAAFEFDGTPVFLDVEGLPDRDFYYLIGLIVGSGQRVKSHSLWADDRQDEARIWQQFLRILARIDRPQIIHYGSYESRFFANMRARYASVANSKAEFALDHAINLLSVIYSKIYFPTFSNGLKEIGQKLGCRWTDPDASGAASIIWREQWDSTRSNHLRDKILLYNEEDCLALSIVADTVKALCEKKGDLKDSKAPGNEGIVNIDSLKREKIFPLGRNDFALPELDQVNRAAYWDYQRTRIILRTDKHVKEAAKAQSRSSKKVLIANKIVNHFTRPDCCPNCNDNKFEAHRLRRRVVLDIAFGRYGIKRWIVRHIDRGYLCKSCGSSFYRSDSQTLHSKYGCGFRSYVIYQLIELRIPGTTISRSLNQLLGFNIPNSAVPMQKRLASIYYEETYNEILKQLVSGSLIHVDETQVTIDRSTSYVWVFASHNSVAYKYTDTREGAMVQEILLNFKGVLVTDFYSAYDSINCPQQKCLIHLIRDINEDLLKNPFDVEFKQLVSNFSVILKSIIETIDRFGLKSRFLRKHKRQVAAFFRMASARHFESELAKKYLKRFIKNADRLFTFLDYDNVPWNNNNAEHAIKPFAMLRHHIGGLSSPKGISEYLILLSIEETCKYRGVSFLDFLLSGERSIDTFCAMPRSRLRSCSSAGIVANT